MLFDSLECQRIAIIGMEHDQREKSLVVGINDLLDAILSTSNWLKDELSLKLRKYGLTIPQYSVLRILREHYPASVKVSVVISSMIEKSSNVSRIVDKLEFKNLATRRQSTADKRAVDVVICQKGIDILDQVDQELVRISNELTLTSAQQEQLGILLNTLKQSELA